ncbi:PREDICTED: uncharacterized protein LOC109591350 [Amphimedon queenslandica]|uniref:Ubiquitin carboxyl-terminal hydrolase 47 C-terminal domain-containing protein n=1 Tax=Amphimedon queenslandica TaxID=400682 RepID=A0AAN0K072_AMPQE|nr:PREDICTED: uncharacterized protein LOC109591350 [Amphimedon queenslandica]|eukprot:XP_019862659.1 PREDICTED: uncharacterized protein LOC109591350 [Amphimedon queenslandica]
MRIVMEEEDYRRYDTSVRDISDVGGTLRDILIIGRYKQFYVSSDPKDYQKEFKDSLMYKYVDFHVNSILLKITLPPAPVPEATPTTTNVTEGGIIMKIISMNEKNKGKERKIQVQVDKRITLAQLKEELVPLIGVPPTGFRVYRISGNKEIEMEGLDKTLKDIDSESELIVRLGRGLGRGEKRIKLYLLQVNNTEFCNFMMESIVAEGTPLSELSGVPAKYIYFTRKQSFPVEISCLDIENKLKWYSISSDRYLLGLYDGDGDVIYYKY